LQNYNPKRYGVSTTTRFSTLGASVSFIKTIGVPTLFTFRSRSAYYWTDLLSGLICERSGRRFPRPGLSTDRSRCGERMAWLRFYATKLLLQCHAERGCCPWCPPVFQVYLVFDRGAGVKSTVVVMVNVGRTVHIAMAASKGRGTENIPHHPHASGRLLTTRTINIVDLVRTAAANP